MKRYFLDSFSLDSLSNSQLMDLQHSLDLLLNERGISSRSSTQGHSEKSPLTSCRLNPGFRRLTPVQLEQLTLAFQQWVRESRDMRTRRSREKVFLIFQVLRYTGARLGEVLKLDENRDFDFENSQVRISSPGTGDETSYSREVPLPPELCGAIQKWCQSNPEGNARQSRKGGLFRIDQGFLRRKFQEQQPRSSLPAELLNPRCLRNSRAAELVQGGMPLPAVRTMLGCGGSDLPGSLEMFEDNELKHVVRQYCKKEFDMETSARNTFHGHITRVETSPVLSRVTLQTGSGYEISAVITSHSLGKLGLEPGSPATALVKATWIMLEKGRPAHARDCNALPGTITRVNHDGVLTEVQGVLKDGTPVCALITTESQDLLDIEQGREMFFMFKALSVVIC